MAQEELTAELGAVLSTYVRKRDRRVDDVALVFSEASARLAAETTSPGVFLVACTPQAASTLDFMGRPYAIFEDTYDISIFADIESRLLDDQAAWARKVDEFALRHCSPLRESGLRPASAFFFDLKVIADMHLRAWIELSATIRYFACIRLHFFEEPTDKIGSGLALLPGEPHGSLIGQVAAFEGVELIRKLPSKPESAIGPGVAERISRVVRDIRQDVSVQWNLLHRFGPLARLRRFAATRRKATLVYEPCLEIEAAAVKLRASGVNSCPLPWSASHLEKSDLEIVRRFGRQIQEEPWFWRNFSIAQGEAPDSSRRRVDYWLSKLVPDALAHAQEAGRRLRKDRTRAVVVRSPVTPRDHGWLAAARTEGIATVSVQHGGFEGNCAYELYRCTDLAQTDFRLTYGTLTSEYLSTLSPSGATEGNRSAAVVTVGSPRLDMLRSDLKALGRRRSGSADPERVFLYVATSYQYQWYAARQSYLAGDYFRFLGRVMRILASADPATRLIYRPFPEMPSDPYALTAGTYSPRIRVDTTSPMHELLEESDAHIIDIPSTTLLESMLQPKPILLLADNRCVTLEKKARDLLARRTVLAESQEDFLNQLPLFLGNPFREQINVTDESFLRGYATFRNDGRSGERVAKALAAIAQVHHGRML